MKGTLWKVLISTYWNVNNISGQVKKVLSPGFNLNLLECKLTKEDHKKYKRYCFNLNLLECKWRHIQRRLHFAAGFNLNLLECKSTPHTHVLLNFSVLISTYWNVNALKLQKKRLNNSVLISTYWNVNYDAWERNGWLTVVLISTYWNVNDCECAVLLRPTQF